MRGGLENVSELWSATLRYVALGSGSSDSDKRRRRGGGRDTLTGWRGPSAPRDSRCSVVVRRWGGTYADLGGNRRGARWTRSIIAVAVLVPAVGLDMPEYCFQDRGQWRKEKQKEIWTARTTRQSFLASRQVRRSRSRSEHDLRLDISTIRIYRGKETWTGKDRERDPELAEANRATIRKVPANKLGSEDIQFAPRCPSHVSIQSRILRQHASQV